MIELALGAGERKPGSLQSFRADRQRRARSRVVKPFCAGRLIKNGAKPGQHVVLLALSSGQPFALFSSVSLDVSPLQQRPASSPSVARGLFALAWRRKWQLSVGLGSLLVAALSLAFTYMTVAYPPAEKYKLSYVGFAVLAGAAALYTIVALFMSPKEAQLYENLLDENQRLKAEKGALQARLSAADDDLVRAAGYIQEARANHLIMLAKKLKYGLQERISVYRHSQDGQDGNFELTGRYSKNESYSRPGRSLYPAHQGCMGKAWIEDLGWSAITNLPNPKRDREEWLKRLNDDFEIPPDVASKLRMPVRSIAAVRIDSALGEKRIGVIVFESTDPNRIRVDDLRELIEQETARFQLLLQQRPLAQSTDAAAERGF
jgi:hypothetical protein